MAEELAFARKASGLVRGLSMTDAFAVGFMNQGITPSIWTMITWGLGTYLTGNLFWATVISLLMVGFGFPLVWGILSGSMPRSGGEYIYNSRIINPIVAIAESFGNAFVMIFWVYILAPWVADPGLVIIAEYQGWDWLYNVDSGEFFGLFSYEWGVFIVATITNVIAFLTIVFGVKIFALIQKGVMIFALGGAAVVTGALTFTSKANIAESWDAFAAEYDSLTYAEVVPAVSAAIGEAVPTSSTLYGTLGVMVAGSWLFAYAYFCVFVAGEVKRPDKTLIAANFVAVLVPALLMIWTSLAMYRVMDFEFISATAWIDNNGGIDGYTLPFLPSYMSLAYIAHSNWFVALAAGGSFMLFCFWYVALSYPRLPADHLRLGHGPHGPEVVHRHQPALGVAGQELHPLLRALPGRHRAVHLLDRRVHAGPDRHRHGDRLRVGCHDDRGPGLPLHEALQGHLGLLAVQELEVPRRAARLVGRLVSLVYLGILFYFLIMTEEMRDSNRDSWILYAVVWVIGIIWYFFWTARSKKVGVDVSMTYGELPPE